MKKVITILSVIIVLLVLVVPIYKKNDDGSKEFNGLLYKVKIDNNGKSIKILGKEFNSKKSDEKDNKINSIDEFYDREYITSVDIRKLPEDYSLDDAINDNCFVIGDDVHNDSLFSKFMADYEKKNNSFIRVVQFTIEGDMYIYDVIYDMNIDKLYIVSDGTRDKYGDFEIHMDNYEYMAMYEYLNHTYWVLYNGELNDKTLFSDNTFIISYV